MNMTTSFTKVLPTQMSTQLSTADNMNKTTAIHIVQDIIDSSVENVLKQLALNGEKKEEKLETANKEKKELLKEEIRVLKRENEELKETENKEISELASCLVDGTSSMC